MRYTVKPITKCSNSKNEFQMSCEIGDIFENLEDLESEITRDECSDWRYLDEDDLPIIHNREGRIAMAMHEDGSITYFAVLEVA